MNIKLLISILLIILIIFISFFENSTKLIINTFNFGSLHPISVHFPVVLIIATCTLGLFGSFRRKFLKEGTFEALLYLSAISSLIALFLGYQIDPTIEGVNGDNYSYHKYFGGALTIYIILLAQFSRHLSKISNKYLSKIIYLILLILVLFTGHRGGILTHGVESFFLSKYKQFNSNELIKLSKQLPDIVSENFNKNVHPILDKHCIECHGTDKRRGGLRLDSIEQIFFGGSSGSIISTNYNNESEIIRRLKLDSNHSEFMPKNGKKLTNIEIEMLSDWIFDLSKYSNLNSKGFHYEQIKDRTLKKVKLNKISSKFSNPIDIIIDKYFLDHKIDWQLAASNKNLIKRLYLDLIGRMPNQHEMDKGLNLLSQNKIDSIVNALISNKIEYTTHWLSFWNDLLRNDYNGVGFNGNGRKQITKWLISSIYNNKPYNKMAIELLTKENGAEGFLYGISWVGDKEPHQIVPIQAAQNVSNVFLGIDMRCSTCHDSFTNSWRLKDLYSFAQIFSKNNLDVFKCGKKTTRKVNYQFLFPNIKPRVDSTKLNIRLNQLSKAVTAKENGNFTINFVNRIWERLMGRGIIEPLYHISNKPWSSDLINWLAGDFINNNYDIKKLIKTIVSSKIYQSKRLSVTEDVKLFKGPLVSKMSAEQVLDSLFYISNQWPKPSKKMLSLDTSGQYKLFTSIVGKKVGVRASILPVDELQKIFGRLNREQSIAKRNIELNSWSIFQLLNNKKFNTYIEKLSKYIDKHSVSLHDKIKLSFNLLFYKNVSDKKVKFYKSYIINNNIKFKEFLWSLIMQPSFLLIS